jgi:hypothetical protein
MSVIPIKVDSSGALSFEGDRLATVQEWILSDRSADSIFVLLCPGQWVELVEGIFQLAPNLSLYISVNIDSQVWVLKSISSVKIEIRDRTHHANQL